MTWNCHNPGLVVKAVFSLSWASSSTCQYPLFKSRVGNQLAPAKDSSVSSIRGKGYESLRVDPLLFKITSVFPIRRSSRQHCSVPGLRTPHLVPLLKSTRYAGTIVTERGEGSPCPVQGLGSWRALYLSLLLQWHFLLCN